MSPLNQAVLVAIVLLIGAVALIADWRARRRLTRRCCPHDCTSIRRANLPRPRTGEPK
ncbi:hypothetical protein [Peterkaempfera sp. SMS 1(5)a]|uniref:hypothetical protein n=1 Tax=Peterkaempfera podocarpi TaxID=3232308 RepID=UPI00366E0185